MYGPMPIGHMSNKCRESRPPLRLDRTYRVVREFIDLDGGTHIPGETWKFVGSSYLPYHDGLSLFVQNEQGEWHIRFKLDLQYELWPDFATYVEEISQ